MRGKLWVAAIAVAGILLCVRGTGQAQEKEKAAGKKIAIRAGRLIDGKSETALTNALILIEGERVVGLPQVTVVPGVVNTHTHLVLSGDITAEDYDAQLLKQSIPYRAILSARNARIAMDHGFTTIRDLETEGAMYADVDVKTAIVSGEVPG